MQILLIRHCARENQPSLTDRDQPLSAEGHAQARRLKETIVRLDLAPELYLTSEYEHARQTAQDLAGFDTPKDRLLKLAALTPHSQTESLEEILDEAQNAGKDMKDFQTIAIVGHEPRLSQLLTRLTSARSGPFGRSELVCTQAESLTIFLQGKGKTEFRWPVADHQEAALREKIASKMAVSTFLAGFTSAILFDLLLQGSSLNVYQIVAALCLTASLALFIVSVYLYDRLSMPEGFWAGSSDKGSLMFHGKEFWKDLAENGPLYAHMVWIWLKVFTPAVGLGLFGFAALLLDTRNVLLIIGSALIVGASLWYYRVVRPRLSVD